MPPKRASLRWVDLPEHELLDVRLCDLDLRVEGTWLEEPIERLREDLSRRSLRINPPFWLSEEWFCPEGGIGIAIPFYLAHPRLVRLEQRMMRTVEGRTRGECIKLLRHECGHAVQHAFLLQRRRSWQRVFGKTTQPYPEAYRPRPGSRRFVQHLGYWYAQSHPTEDFAETFALWLDPRSGWRRKYEGWPALRKLEYVDQLMEELAGIRPPAVVRARVDALPTLRRTLRDYYAEKKERYGSPFSDLYDQGLRSLFVVGGAGVGEPATALLRRHRRQIRKRVARWMPDHAYTVDHVFKEILGRAGELRLRAVGGADEIIEDFVVFLTAESMRCLYQGRDWHAM